MTNANHREMATSGVQEFLADRLAASGQPPGIREATIDLVTEAFAEGSVDRLAREQYEQLLHPRSTTEPDAYLAHEAAIENALQLAAAGMRTASAQNGLLLDPVPFERALTGFLTDDPSLALRAELSRIPRPTTRPESLQWSLEPAPWASDRDDNGLWPPEAVQAAASQRRLPHGPAALARIDSGPHANWVQIALIEQHTTPAHHYPQTPRRETVVILGIEVNDREPPLASMPLGSADWQLWTTSRPPDVPASQIAAQLAEVEAPLAACADNGRGSMWLRRTGPGAPPFALVPIPPLIIAFDLKPTSGVCGLSLSDATGPALISRHWRGHPVHDGNYQPLFPSVEGTDLIMRPDLFSHLIKLTGETRAHAGIAVGYQPDDTEE